MIKREFSIIEFENGNIWISDKNGQQIVSLQRKKEDMKKIMNKLEKLKEEDWALEHGEGFECPHCGGVIFKCEIEDIIK